MMEPNVENQLILIVTNCWSQILLIRNHFGELKFVKDFVLAKKVQIFMGQKIFGQEFLEVKIFQRSKKFLTQ